MTREYRPRIRVNRKRPVGRKGKFIVVACETEDDAVAVEAFLVTMFEAAKRDKERTKAIMEQQRVDAQYAALVLPEGHEIPVEESPTADVDPEPSEDE